MNENNKVAIKIKYEHNGLIKVCYGDINDNKLKELEGLENFDEGVENYILIENDGEPNWKAKHSVIFIERMGETSTVFNRRQKVSKFENRRSSINSVFNVRLI